LVNLKIKIESKQTQIFRVNSNVSAAQHKPSGFSAPGGLQRSVKEAI